MTWVVAVAVIVLVIVLVNVVMRGQARRLHDRVRRERPGWETRRAHVVPALGPALEQAGLWRPELRNLAGSDLVLTAGADRVELWCPPGRAPVLAWAWDEVSAVVVGSTTWEFTQVPAVVLQSRHGVSVPVVLASGSSRHGWADAAATEAFVADLRRLRDEGAA
jgi:hypothetical protein